MGDGKLRRYELVNLKTEMTKAREILVLLKQFE